MCLYVDVYEFEYLCLSVRVCVFVCVYVCVCVFVLQVRSCVLTRRVIVISEDACTKSIHQYQFHTMCDDALCKPRHCSGSKIIYTDVECGSW